VPLKRNTGILLFIAVGALALRIVLAGAQLPHHYQADEFQVVERALRVGAGELNPGLFTWPGTLVIYLNFLLFAGYYVVARAAGLAGDAASFAALYWQSPGAFYFMGRALSSAFGVVAVIAVARWARSTSAAEAGWVAATVVALAPAALKAGAVALPDTAAIALGTVSLALGASYLREPKLSRFVAAAALLGLGAAAKYHILLYAPALVTCALAAPRIRTGKAKVLLAGAAATVVAFVVACPFAVLDAQTFFGDLALMARRPGMARWAPTPLYFLGTTLPLTFGWPLLVMVVAGVFQLGRRRDLQALVVALAAAPFIIAALVRPLAPRLLLPLVPPLAVGAGWAVGALAGQAGRRVRITAVAASAVVLAAALALDVGHVAWAWREDSRTSAANYVEAEIPPGSTLILESLPPDVDGPPLWPSKAALSHLIKYYREAGNGSPGRFGYFLKSSGYPFGHRTYNVLLVPEIGDFAEAPRPSYAVRVVPDDADYFAEQGKPPGAAFAPWDEKYREFLDEQGLLIKELSGAGRPGPTVEIYELN
jgi:hypothetical protein